MAGDPPGVALGYQRDCETAGNENVGDPNLIGTICRLGSGVFLIRHYETAIAIGRLMQSGGMAKAWPRMLKLTAEGAAVFVTEGGADVEVLEQQHAVLGPGVAESLVRIRFSGSTDPDLGGEFWMTEKALTNLPG
ncbi:MAG: hypothetical protein H7338_21580 [Candidatus Sericytochromatia bacterium]|nr:hypothetical protein [Candidatus Sericytochromatia bacterium]